MAANVYERLERECETHIEAALEALLGQTPNALAFLSLMQTCWSAHCEEMHTLRSIFLYLDRTYVMQAPADADARAWPLRVQKGCTYAPVPRCEGRGRCEGCYRCEGRGLRSPPSRGPT